MTILDYFLLREASSPNDVFLRQPSGRLWKDYTWKDCGNKARHLLSALIASGYQKGDRICILSANCAEWIICDVGLMLGGFISVPLYSNINAFSMKKILVDSGCKAIITGKLNSEDWFRQREVIPSSVKIISMDGYELDGCTSWSDFCQDCSAPLITKVTSEDIMTIIYTSGTTGDPKGVVHTFGSIINAVKVASEQVGLNRSGNRFISYLPLSHAAERGLIECGGIYCGGSIAFIESLESFSSNVQDIQPTHFFGVPRIWEKFQEKILERIPPKRLDILLKIPFINKGIIKKIKNTLGLSNADIILSGAAPLAPDIINWFQKFDIHIREAYGMSENFNVISMNPIGASKVGTVGKLFPGQEIIIDEETNEIKQKCNWLMKEYYNNPKQTNETIINGFLHTGDMGQLSEDGYLKITGRVKDIFKTTKGEYISPSMYELPFSDLKIVDQVCVMGTFYPQPFVYISLSKVADRLSQNEIAEQLTRILKKLNEGAMEYQMLKKVIISKDHWTIENGLLTPTLKIKRNILSERYEPILKNIYAQKELISWEK